MTPKEVDCGDCTSQKRCWADECAPGAGFVVRRVTPLDAGETLFRQGAAFDAPCVVTSGCIGVTELRADGTERIVAFRFAGEVVGLESWNQRTHRHGAYAVAPATLCRLRWSTGGAIRSAVLLRALLAKATAQSADFSMPWAGLPAVERVRAFVGDFHRRSRGPLPMTRAQIGQYLGLAEETVVRALKTLDRAA